MATFHDDLAALRAEFEDKGYFYLASRGTAGPLGVLRYNLEEMPAFEVAAAWAHDRAQAAALADAALAAGPSAAAPVLHGGRFEGALDALRDCVAWNTVWDASNRRPYTALSRRWVAQKFGGLGGVAQRRDLPWADGRPGRRGPRPREPARRFRRRDAPGKPALPGDRKRRLDRPLAAAHRRLRDLVPLPARRRQAFPRRGLAGAQRQPRVVVARARRQRQRPPRIRHLAGRRRAVSRHQARRQGRVHDGQLAGPRRGGAG